MLSASAKRRGSSQVRVRHIWSSQSVHKALQQLLCSFSFLLCEHRSPQVWRFSGKYHPSTTSTTSPIFYSLYNDINQTKVKRKKNLFNNSSQMIVLIYIPKLLTPEFILIYIWILQFEGNVTGQFSKVVHPYSTKMTLRGTEVAFEFQSFCCICQLAFTFCRSVKKPTELVTNRKLDRPIVIMAHMFLHQVEKHTFGCLSHNYLPQGK